MARHRHLRRAAALALLAALAATGCGDADSGGAGAPSTPAAAAPAPSTPVEGVPDLPARPFTASPVLVDSRPIPFTSYSRVADDRIAVVFETGSPECYGVDAKVVAETADTVTVELRGGTRPDAVGRTCVMIAVTGSLEVALPSPLGQRQVLSAV